MRSGAAGARRAFRWAFLHRRDVDRRVLPAGVSGAATETEERTVFPFGGSRGGSRLPALPALPAGSVAGNAGVAGCLGQRFAGAEAHRRERARRRRSGGSRGTTGHRFPPSAASVSQISGRDTRGGRSNPPRALRQEADRRDQPDHDEIAMASGFGSIRRFNATFQNLYGRSPGESAQGDRARSERSPGRSLYVPDRLPPAL